MNKEFYIILYIDPSTGSAIISIIVSVFTVLFFLIKKVLIYIKYHLNFNKSNNIKFQDNNKKNIVIFSDSKRYVNVFKPILDEFENRKINVTYYTFDNDDPILSFRYNYIQTECIGNSSVAYSKLNVLDAHIVLSTTPSLDVYQWKRSKNVDKYVHILHEVGGATEYRLFGLDFYDSVLLSGNFQIEQIRNVEENRKIKRKELVVVGSPCMDYLQNQVDDCKKQHNENKTILLAPTWGKNSLLNMYSNKLLDALIDTNYKIIIRPHPQSFVSEKKNIDNYLIKYKESDNLNWDFDVNNFQSLYLSDILISDFSGVILEYAFCFKKPIISNISNVDVSLLDAYYQTIPMWRYKTYSSISVLLNENVLNNLKEYIDNTIENYDDSIVEKYSNEAWEYKGEGAKKTVDYIISCID